MPRLARERRTERATPARKASCSTRSAGVADTPLGVAFGAAIRSPRNYSSCIIIHSTGRGQSTAMHRRAFRKLVDGQSAGSSVPALGAQLEALDLARRRLRQLGTKFDPAGIFVRRERRLHVFLQRPGELRAR